MSFIVPIIETERLVLRAHRSEDMSAATEMWSDPIVVKHIGGRPFTAQETWSKILRYHGLWSLTGFGYWAIEEKSSKQFIGELGFADFKREMTPSIDKIPELGWAFVSKVHGQGYATEALKTLVAWGDANLESRRTVCIIDPDNIASIRVAVKCGYVEKCRTTYAGHPTILFDRNRND